MNFFGVVSTVLLGVMLFWTIYHARLLFAGIRSRQNLGRSSLVCSVEKLPKFSIIVPAKDEATVIHRCLDSLMRINYPREKIEIIVVAGTSKDATKEICSKFSEKHPETVKVVFEDSSKGKPAALNLAFAQATGEFTGIFDADSVPDEDVLQRIASYFQDPSVSAIQGSAVSLNESQNMLTRIAAAEDKAWLHGLLHGRERLELFVSFAGSCQFIRNSVLKEMGGWDESSLAEDVEMSLKLVKHGYYVKYTPDVSCGQETSFNLRGLITQRTRWYRGYMEASIKYGSLIYNINRRVIDAELSLIGPFVMIICLTSYINWGLSLLFGAEGSLFPFSSTLPILLTSVTLISLGMSMAFFEKPVRIRNVLWIPFIYGYWFVQMFIASWAFLQFVFRRRRVWEKTVKSGFIKSDFAASGVSPSISSSIMLPKLKVCFVSSYPPNIARLSEYARSLVNELANRPAIDRIYLLSDKSASSEQTLKCNPKITLLRVWKADSFLSILEVMRCILKLKPDIVHFNIGFQSWGKSRIINFTGLSLILLCRFSGFRVLAELHNLGETVDLEKVRLKPSLLNRMGILFATKFILSAQRVVVLVRSYADILKKRYGHLGVRYIPHGATVSIAQRVDPDEKVILFFGHMGPHKGLPVLLKVFEEMRQEKRNVKLIVAGASHPNFPSYLKQFVKVRIPNVIFLGYVPEENLEHLFKQSDVVVIPYLVALGTSGVFHLACGYGRPVVASDLSEFREIVADGASALLVPPDNVNALKEAVLKALFDGEVAARMSEQNLKFAQKRSWSLVAGAYEEEYLELLNC